MKQLLTFFLTALLAFSVGWAATVTDVLDYQVLELGSSYANFTGKTATSDAVYAGNAMKGSGNTIQLRSTNSNSGIVTTGSGGKARKVTVVWNSNTSNGRDLMIYGKNTAYSAATDLYASSTGGTYLGSIVKGTSTSLTITGDYEYIGFRSQSGAMYLTSVTIDWEQGGGTSVAAPTISPAGGEFVTSQTVTLSHADADAIYYTTDGNDPTTSSTQYTAPFTINETTTVKAIAVKNNTPSSVASATFTKLPGVATVANANALNDNTKFGFTGNAVVTYQNGNNLWIRDQTRDTNSSGLIYGSVSGTFANGAILDAGWTATKTTYNGVPEFTSPSGVSSSNSTTADPEPLTTITTGDVNKYVSLSNVNIAGSSTSNNITNYTVNGASYVLRDHFNLVTLTVGKTYNVVGVVSIYNNAPQLYLISATEVISATPTITVSPTSLTINDSGTNNSFTVEATNLENNDQGNVGVNVSSSDFGLTFSSSTNETVTWGFLRDYNRKVHGAVAVNYNGRELSATTTVTAATQGDSKTVDVNYVADLYIVTDNGVTGQWDFNSGTPMTNNNGVYTATFTANNPNTYILFARKTGEGVNWNTRFVFGPVSDNDWELPASGNGNGNIDLNDDDPIKIQGAGTYIITINANAGTFTIEKEVVNTGDFVLVTDISQLEMGNEVIIVNSGSAGSARTMGQRNANNYYGTAVEVSANKKVTATDATQIFTLELGTGGWYFKTSDNLYLSSNTSTSNYLQTKGKDENGTGTSLAAISIDNDNKATIVFQGNGSRKHLRYNANGIATNPNNNDIFSCYQSATNQNDVYIYQRSASVEPSITVDPTSLSFVNPADGTPQSQTVTVTESNTTGTTSVSITGDGANNFSATLNNGTLTVTYSGTATQANPDVATITLTNGEATATVTVTGYKLPVTLTITPADGHTFQGSTVNGMIESNVDGATIEYSFDGTTWQTYDANEGFTATVNTVGGTVTVYARTTVNGETVTAQATYTRIAKVTTCTADIVFAPTSNNGGVTQWNTLKDHISEGSDYVSSATMATIYTSQTYESMRFGSGSSAGNLALTLDLTKFTGGECKLNRVIINAARYSSDTDCQLNVSTDVDPDGITLDVTADQSNFADYSFNFTDHTGILTLTIANMGASARVYVHSITIEYNCGSSVEAPIIEPATGTYYADQTVTITDATNNAVIYYTTDGTDPTTSSTQYNGSFTVPYVAGGSTTVKAIAVITQDDEQTISEVASETYTWGTPSVTIHPDSRFTTDESMTVTLTGTPADATIYYTTDGSTPSATNGTEYTGAFTVDLNDVGDQVTVRAVAVYNNVSSNVASATYTRVDHLIDVATPFFSPLQDHIYYGDQTLEIGCTTPNADIYYEIVEVSGEVAPDAASVEDPTHTSRYYDGTPIPMTAGNSYYVKAIAYIGNYASIIGKGWYVIKPFTATGHVYQNLKDFNDNCPTGVTATFANPVQVVYHSTYTNNGEFAEFCYLRDNTDYACVYFGKRDTHDYTIFKMGDWIDGSQIAGKTNIWERNFHIQLGTGNHEVTSWPSTAIGWSEIIPEEITNAVIVAGTAEGSNSWGHYVHLRNTTLRNVQDYGQDDPKHTGMINDGTADAYYYDKFYRWSAGTCSYDGHNDVINHLGDYDQAFFDEKQNAGATFDVYGIVDYYSQYNPPFEICPIDFLWTYKPVMTPATTTSFEPVTVNITATQPEWAAEDVVIYYKTDDMEEWAVYTEPITVNSTTTIQAYAEVPAKKTDGANYNDMVRSEVISETYTIEGIEDPTISPASQVIEIVNGNESVTVTITDHNVVGSGAVTTYTINGVEYTLEAGQSTQVVVTETTTITAVSSIVYGEHTLYSNEQSETYTFVKKNGVIFDLVKTAPQVGNVYVIVNKKAYMGMSTTQNTNNRGSVGVMFTDETKDHVYGNDELAQFVLERANAGRYYFKNVNGSNTGYLVVTTNAAANLNTAAAASTYAEAGVTIGANAADVDMSYPATVTFSYDGAVRTLRYYANGRTFSTYGDASLNEDVFLYGIEATPLAFIEENKHAGDHVVVSDQLVGAWAVVTPDGERLLWVKDQDNRSIIATYNENNDLDYMKEKWPVKPQVAEWDQSNWAVIDFANQPDVDPQDYVNKYIQGSTIVGTYSNELTYTITLDAISEGGVQPIAQGETEGGYYGYLFDQPHGDPLETQNMTPDYAYNQYTPVNFLEKNLFGNGKAGENARAIEPGTPMFFMNPKIMEVAHVWGVYAGNGRFDVYENEGNTNGFDLEGAVDVFTWKYNRLSNEEGDFGQPIDITVGKDYSFHAVVVRQNFGYGYRANSTSMLRSSNPLGSEVSPSLGIYPLDLPSGDGGYTSVKDVVGGKTVVGVRYYNIMGMESKTPFEGINIVVTQYSDGTRSTAKILR